MRIVCPESKSQLVANTPLNVQIDQLKFLETPLSHMLNNSVLHYPVLSAVHVIVKTVFLAEFLLISIEYVIVRFCTSSLCQLNDQ